MKTSTVFAAVAAVVFAASSAVGAQAQNEPQAHPAPAQAPTSGPAPAPPAHAISAPAAPSPPVAQQHIQESAGDPAKPTAGDPPLTKEESEKALSIVQTCGGVCHGIERFEGKRYDRAGWQQVMDIMGPNAELSKADTALVVRYLTANLAPPPKP